MRTRVQIVLKPEERERFQQQAESEGLSLSSWLRKVANENLASGIRGEPLATREDLRAFFRRCDAQEEGKEPGWKEHLKTMERSRQTGRAET